MQPEMVIGTSVSAVGDWQFGAGAVVGCVEADDRVDRFEAN